MSPDKVLEKRSKIANKLKSDVAQIYEVLRRTNIKEFNLQSRFTWKRIYDGYGDKLRIFDGKPKLWTKKIVVYDALHISEYERFIEEQNTIIFDIIHEGTEWVEKETKKLAVRIDEFNKKYEQHSLILEENVTAYKVLEKFLKC